MMKILTLAGVLLVLAALVFAAFHYMTVVPGRSHTGPLPALGDGEAALAARLRKHIEAIATRPHNLIHYAALEEAARYIEDELRSLGYEPATQVFHTQGKAVRNIEATIEPSDPARFRGTVVLGAHYDSYGDAPGANDNGTGAAAVIELARRLIDLRNAGDLRIRLVLFVNEEPPYFKTDAMGSLHYARLLAERREPVIGMISLETLGCFNDVPGSQRYPAPFGLLYPREGNFVAFVATLGSRKLLHALIESFRRHTAFPTVGGVAPGIVPGIDWSDHWSFEQFRYPAIMLTDTALYRYPHYHLPSDTPDKVDTEKLARITRGIESTVRDMAKSDWPTTAVRPPPSD
jgi:Zn-dependent M28 family amino/carboxypeptidase